MAEEKDGDNKLIIAKRSHIESEEGHVAGRYSVTGVRGLYLDVKRMRAGEKTPVRAWVLRIMHGYKFNAKGEKKPNIIERTIGYYSDVSLSDARETAILWARELRNGNDVGKRAAPLVASSVGMTFAEAAPFVFDEIQHGMRSDERGKRQWLRSLEIHAFPVIGNMLLTDITAKNVAQIVKKPTGTDGRPFWLAKHSQAVKVLFRTYQVFEWAIAETEDNADETTRVMKNPADRSAKTLKRHIPKYEDPAHHHAALPYKMIPVFMRHLRNDTSRGARPLEFTLLTGVRSKETRLVSRDEIDLDKAQWTIPQMRTKTNKEHEVPLSRQAVELIEAIPPCPTHPKVIFRGASAIHINEAEMLKTMRVIRDRHFPDMKVTVHGLRSSIRDWIAEQTDFSFEIGEAVLSHTLKGVDNTSVDAYLRTTYYPQRVELMQQWADYCYGVEVEPTVKPEAVALIEKLRELGLSADDIKAAL